jgi:hypothetical protein
MDFHHLSKTETSLLHSTGADLSLYYFISNALTYMLYNEFINEYKAKVFHQEILTKADREIISYIPQIYFDDSVERLITDVEKLRSLGLSVQTLKLFVLKKLGPAPRNSFIMAHNKMRPDQNHLLPIEGETFEDTKELLQTLYGSRSTHASPNFQLSIYDEKMIISLVCNSMTQAVDQRILAYDTAYQGAQAVVHQVGTTNLPISASIVNISEERPVTVLDITFEKVLDITPNKRENAPSVPQEDYPCGQKINNLNDKEEVNEQEPKRDLITNELTPSEPSNEEKSPIDFSTSSDNEDSLDAAAMMLSDIQTEEFEKMLEEEFFTK